MEVMSILRTGRSTWMDDTPVELESGERGLQIGVLFDKANDIAWKEL